MVSPEVPARALGRKRVLLVTSIVCCSALLSVAFRGSLLHVDSAAQTALYGVGEEGLHASDLGSDVSGLKGLDSEVTAALGENRKLSGEFNYMVKDQKLARCTSLRDSGCSADVVDNYLANLKKATQRDPSAGCCGEEDEGAQKASEEPAAGDQSVGAVVRALEKKFHRMKQQFREIRADYYHGAPRTLAIRVSPRGPPGFTGRPGTPGPSGVQGEQGAVGPVGPRGYRGYKGPRGPVGRRGKKGMTGSIGEAGNMGPTGYQGLTGDRGFPGPPGAKGLPGAAGVMGANGKDGPPGPPGRNGVPGPPGLAGDQGNPGAPGTPGKPGPAGPPGSQGITGVTGEIGPAGPDGAPGKDGVGPAKPGPVKKAGKGTWGPQFLKTRECTKLGVQDNLGGECKPLCENCDSTSGFMLVNEDGLRYKDMAFDGSNGRYGEGTIQAKNVCMLARYGNKGAMTVVPDDSSYMTLVDKKDVKDQVKWYGKCPIGSAQEAKCCTNSKVMTAGFDFTTFATGGQCGGDYTKGKPTKVLFCVFDKAAYIRQSRPAGPPKYPPTTLQSTKSLKSNGKIFEMNLLSENGIYQASMQRDGNFVVYRQGGVAMWESKTSGKGQGPFKLVMQGDGNLVLYDTKKALWSSGTWGKPGVKVVMQNDGNLVLYSSTGAALWSTQTAQKNAIVDNVNLKFDQAVCIGTACLTGALFSRIKTVSDGFIESGTGSSKMQCQGGPAMPEVTVKFYREFSAPPKVFINLVGIHNCQNGHANFRARIKLLSVTKTEAKFSVGTWADTRVHSMQWSYMAVGPELTANVQNYKSRNKKSGDDSRGILCVGRYCAGETMIDRLNKMANVHVQTNRYDVIWGNCGTGAFNKRRINFQRPFTETPQVIVSIAHYDLCHFHGYNRALTYVESADANGFTAVAQTWADTRLYGLVIEWIAFPNSLMNRPQQYFPIVPAPTDPIAKQMCFGNTCVREAEKFKDIMNMANWRVESKQTEYYWHCHTRSVTLEFTFKEAFEFQPEVKLFVYKIDECGFTSFKWSTDITDVTTAGFKVKLYGYKMYSVAFQWVAYSKDLNPPPLPPLPPPKPQATSTSSGNWGTCFGNGAGTLCDQLGVKDNLCGKCIKLCDKCTGREGFILENTNGLRWKPDGTMVGGTGPGKWKGEFYSWGSSLSSLPSVAGRTPTKVVMATHINYADHAFSRLGFNDRFVVKWTGDIEIKTAGSYTFETCSDDGSRLYIGSTRVVDNDGLHGTRCRQGTISLSAGSHKATIDFFENGGGAVCRVKWKGPDVGNNFVWMQVGENKCCVNAQKIAPGQDWKKFSTGNRCGGDSDLDRPAKRLICYFDYNGYKRLSK